MTDTTEKTAQTDQSAEGVEDQASTTDDATTEPDTETQADNKDGSTNSDDFSVDDLREMVSKLRKENAGWRTKHRDIQDQLKAAKTPDEVQAILADAEAKASAEARELTVENVALSHNLPSDVTALLKEVSWETREQLEAHAKTLAKHTIIENDDDEDADLEGGLTPKGSGESFDPVAYARQNRKRRQF